MYNLNYSNDNYLEGQFLIATPALVGSCFERAVVYLCSHDENGAMGILVNQSLGGVKSSDVFGKPDTKFKAENDVPVYFGGPVESSKGFVLHSDDYKSKNTCNLTGGISLTSDAKILKDMITGKGPDKALLAVGYAGWSAGQLESEILSNTWINVPAKREIIFETKDENKWQGAASLLGVDLNNYSSAVGRA